MLPSGSKQAQEECVRVFVCVRLWGYVIGCAPTHHHKPAVDVEHGRELRDEQALGHGPENGQEGGADQDGQGPRSLH